jgi:hypothetical protein
MPRLKYLKSVLKVKAANEGDDWLTRAQRVVQCRNRFETCCYQRIPVETLKLEERKCPKIERLNSTKSNAQEEADETMYEEGD